MNKITTHTLQVRKKARQKIVMLTAYDYPLAKVLDEAAVDVILVGDSLGNVSLGYKNTVPVTMPEMLMHVRSVARAVRNALLVADLPFGAFQQEPGQALKNAIALVKAGAEAVKLEGTEYLPAVKKIIRAGIPVMGHLGLTPQSVYQLGGYRMQGKEKAGAQRILKQAKQLEQAGCFALVLEMVPEDLARKITRAVKIPTIGIGAGKFCDGQVLVTHDLLGLGEWAPGFVKPKLNLHAMIKQAVSEFIGEVRL